MALVPLILSPGRVDERMTQVREASATAVARAEPLTRKVADRLPLTVEGMAQDKNRELDLSLHSGCPSAGTTVMLEEKAASAVQVTFRASNFEVGLGKWMESVE